VTPRTVLLTGATSGIGRALALAYADPARHLRLLGRDGPRMDSVAALCRARGATVETALADVRDRAAMAAAIRGFEAGGPTELAIAGAGITSGLGPGRDVETPEALRAVLDTNLLGVVNTLEPLLPAMIGRRGGHVAIIGSLGALRGLPSSPGYSAAKAAVHAYAEGMRPRLARHGIAVSLIAPGFVETPLNARIRAPRPLQMTADGAAARIRRGLDRRRKVIAFPLPLYLGLRVLNLLPAAFGDRLLDRPDIDVPETTDVGAAPP
jgi:NAD(P)-dependent dehydrogenase (short-subunit alcohol dehydrogenase family)